MNWTSVDRKKPPMNTTILAANLSFRKSENQFFLRFMVLAKRMGEHWYDSYSGALLKFKEPKESVTHWSFPPPLPEAL